MIEPAFIFAYIYLALIFFGIILPFYVTAKGKEND